MTYSKSDQAGPPRKKRRLAPGSTLAAPTTPMRAFSEKRRAIYRSRYLPARSAFLESHPRCEAKVAGICTRIAEDVHHLIQRSLAPGTDNLMDETQWLATCRPCHTFISDDSTRARAMGLEISPKERRNV